MENTMDKAYIVKKLYIDAARRLYRDRYDYYKNTINIHKADLMVHGLMQSFPCGRNILLNDSPGCCAGRIFEIAARHFASAENVFIIMNDIGFETAMAVYSNCGALIYNTYRTTASVDLSEYYFIPERRNHSNREYTDMIFYFYGKSENIAKDFSL